MESGTDSQVLKPPDGLSGLNVQSSPVSGVRGLALGRRRLVRLVAFRFAAIALGLLPLVLLEAAVRLIGVSSASHRLDPFVGFGELRRLFVQNEGRTRYETAPYRLKHFVLDSFEADKPADEFRIFAIGDSTVQGNPWSIETSFTKWLELSLRAAEPSRSWRVVNCGGISYASYRMVPILEEVLRYEPDLIVVHASHNEFLEDRTYGHIKRLPRAVTGTHELVSRFRAAGVIESGLDWLRARPGEPAANDRTLLAAEVEALLDYRGGLESYHRDDEWRRGVVAHFEFNLRRMTRIARNAGVPLVLMNPVSNLRDSPPFRSEHRTDLTADELDRLDRLWSEARSHYGINRMRSLVQLQSAVSIDDQHAGLRYDLGKCLDAMGLVDDARREFIAAKELDVCPLRMLDEMNEIVLAVGRDTRSPVVDVRGLFERLSRSRIPGGDWLVDHVHPSIIGYRRIADSLADELVRTKVVRPVAGWHERRDELYDEHIRSLDALYFAKGQQHLEALMTWAQGRVTKERPQMAKGPAQ